MIPIAGAPRTTIPLQILTSSFSFIINIVLSKGTVSVILSDPPCTDGIARLTMVPMKLFRIDYVKDIVVFLGLKVFHSNNSNMFSCSRNAQVPFCRETTIEIDLF